MTEKDFSKELGRRIRFLRRNADLTQSELASKVGIEANSFICQIERGQKQPSAFLIHQIERIIGPVWVEGK